VCPQARQKATQSPSVRRRSSWIQLRFAFAIAITVVAHARSIRPRDDGVWTHVRVVVGAGAILAVLVVAVAASFLLADDGTGAETAGVRLEGQDSDIRGVGYFAQEGRRMTGFVVVWGLEPNSEHAVHFHGPSGECGTKADPVAAHPDLRADEEGVAYTNVDLTAEQRLLAGGFYYNVHEGPSSVAENPEIACGDIAPGDSVAARSP
jgi:hypothetical protein